jgi:hypothetical protein
MWRNKAYELGGTSLPWKPEELLRKEYERGFIDGMQKQMQSSVDKAVNGMTRQWVGLTDEEIEEVERWVEFKEEGSGRIPVGKLVRYIEAKLKEKNT